MKNLNVFLMVCMLLVASCNKETDVNLIQQHEGHEVIFSPRIEGHVMTRVSDNNWENGDKIGIFAV